MSTDETVADIAEAPTWDDRVARVRQVPQRHGTDEHAGIYAEVARRVYLPHLAPDYAYIHRSDFYEPAHFDAAYIAAAEATDHFSDTSTEGLTATLAANPQTLLVFRTIVGLTKAQFAASTSLVADALGLPALTPNKVDSMEKAGSATSARQAQCAAATINEIMEGTLFGEPKGSLKTKQEKPDTAEGWASVRAVANHGVPYDVFLHQRHYGGAFRQVLDATSTQRGDLIEDAVEGLFAVNGVPYIRTGSHNQAEIERRFEVAVRPAPDFVIYDDTGALRGMLECKGANDGGTARDKALRFARLRVESVRRRPAPGCTWRTWLGASERHARSRGARLRRASLHDGYASGDAHGRSLPTTRWDRRGHKTDPVTSSSYACR